MCNISCRSLPLGWRVSGCSSSARAQMLSGGGCPLAPSMLAGARWYLGHTRGSQAPLPSLADERPQNSQRAAELCANECYNGPSGALLQMRQRYDGLPPGGGARGWSRWVTCLWTGPGRCRCAFRKPSIAVEQGSASVRPCIGSGGCHPSSAVSRAYGQPYPAQCTTLFQHSAFHSRPLQQARRESGAET